MKELKGKNIIVTGSSGFIGKNLLIRLIKSGATVHAFSRKELIIAESNDLIKKTNVHLVDLLNYDHTEEVIKYINPEYIFNFATPQFNSASASEYLIADQHSKSIIINLLTACLKIDHLSGFIHAGSSLEYQPTKRPIKESENINPYSFKGIIKANESHVCQYYARKYKLPIYIARIFRAYGPWEQKERLIRKSIRAIYNGTGISLVSDNIKKDFIYIDDLIDGLLLLAIKHPQTGSVFNFGSGMSYSVQEIVKILEHIIGKEMNVRRDTYPLKDTDLNYHVADISKAKEMLNWEPKTSITDGLKKVMNWELSNPDW